MLTPLWSLLLLSYYMIINVAVNVLNDYWLILQVVTIHDKVFKRSRHNVRSETIYFKQTFILICAIEPWIIFQVQSCTLRHASSCLHVTS